MAENGHTTIATWVLPIVEALKSYCSTQELLQYIGIDYKSIRDTNQRIPLEKMTRLWSLAETISGNDCIGLEVTKHVSHTNLHALSYAHLASSSIRESLERSARFSDVISTAARIHIRDEQQQVIVSWHNVDDLPREPSIHAMDAFIALLIKSSRTISPDIHKHLISINLTRDKPNNMQYHQLTYNCPINFCANFCEIRFERDFVERHISTGNTELASINEQALSDYLARLRKTDMIGHVNKVLMDLMPIGELSQDNVANILGISSRSLHRKLKEQGTSYQMILDETRKYQAIQYLKEQELPITTITYRLGFYDISSFSRSFKKWTGKSPREYRKYNQQ
ncbi:AraC family transcriptional regulator [Microbulbifer sp. OS29]|uniref:AraC family transcriptional regulator n=1 Tax=Microbulbifer okhotskensis TaxID=2926617 RepID=A0A9X2ERD4_9GAMM|nr:AraC family transcriptional regulator [Microbulbifer okhotskensis]MCO1336431.1 AraC family transcriptional regulator [Microbulbifer okhotskensis]